MKRSQISRTRISPKAVRAAADRVLDYLFSSKEAQAVRDSDKMREKYRKVVDKL